MDNFELLTTAETASLLRVTPSTVRRLTREGVLPAVRRGNFRRYRSASLQRWIEHQEQKQYELVSR